jgi:hypothetical protein
MFIVYEVLSLYDDIYELLRKRKIEKIIKKVNKENTMKRTKKQKEFLNIEISKGNKENSKNIIKFFVG